jgi:hypothetical protein
MSTLVGTIVILKEVGVNDMDAHMATFWTWGLGLVLRVGLSKKLDPTLNTSPAYTFAQNNQYLTLMIINHI